MTITEGVASVRLRAASQHSGVLAWLALNCQTHVYLYGYA